MVLKLNGVIVITSKKAEAGETYITVDHNTVASTISRLHPYQNEYGGGYDQGWDTFTTTLQLTLLHGQHSKGKTFLTYPADESWGPKLDGTLARHWDSWIPDHPNFGELRPWSDNPNNIKNFFETGVNLIQEGHLVKVVITAFCSYSSCCSRSFQFQMLQETLMMLTLTVSVD